MEQASCDRGGAEASGWGGPPYLEKQSRCKRQVVAMAKESRRNPRRGRCSAPVVAAALLRPAAARPPEGAGAGRCRAQAARAGRPRPLGHPRLAATSAWGGREGPSCVPARRPRPWIRPPRAEPRPRSRIHPRDPPPGAWPLLRARPVLGALPASAPIAVATREASPPASRALRSRGERGRPPRAPLERPVRGWPEREGRRDGRGRRERGRTGLGRKEGKKSDKWASHQVKEGYRGYMSAEKLSIEERMLMIRLRI